MAKTKSMTNKKKVAMKEAVIGEENEELSSDLAGVRTSALGLVPALTNSS